MSETIIEEAKARYDKEGFNESDEDQGMLSMLLQKDKRFATVMAFDMIFAGIDTVRSFLLKRLIIKPNLTTLRPQQQYPQSCIVLLRIPTSNKNCEMN